MSAVTGRIAAVLVVAHGTHRPEQLAAALGTFHPEWKVGAVWCGDPSLRPPLDGIEWLDTTDNDAAAEVAIVSGDPLLGEWKRTIAVTRDLLADGFDRVVQLWTGATAVLSPLDPLVGSRSDSITLVARAVRPLADDGLAPGEADLAAEGLYSTNVAVFGKDSLPAVEWLASELRGSAQVGHLLARAAQLFGAEVCTDETIGAGRWRWDCDEPALLDVSGYDSRSPWTLDSDALGPMRIELLGQPQRQRAMAQAESQLAGERTQLCLPGGLKVDAVVRRVVADSEDSQDSAEPPPAPWSESAKFRSWLAPRYWPALHEQRRDLLVAFPDPEGRSAAAFQRWCRGAFSFDDAPLLLAAPEHQRSPLVVADRPGDGGVNLVGYFTRQSGLGDVVRRLDDALTQACVAHSTVASQRSASPNEAAAKVDNRVDFTTSLCVVTADQFPFLVDDFRGLFTATRRMVGYWFWELEHVPLHMRQSIALVEEIWAGSRFVTDAFAAVSPVPVLHVPIPVAEPRPSNRGRMDFRVLADAEDRTVFLAVFDHLSVTERKNPVGLINAFRLAFQPDEGPLLILKTMNGHQRWASHQRVLAAADGRNDIRVWDESLARSDQMALVAAADCMVSLHRSEGLGLHLAEAMWLETPTIATRYSGNLDFMNDDNSLLIDAELVNVEHGEGVYPAVAKWASPDLEQAADAMRRIAGDPSTAARFAAAGRRTMQQQPTLVETGRLISQLLLGRE
ncbi:MAG: glycosyltransferase [Ilumatobacteraceae bacterium]